MRQTVLAFSLIIIISVSFVPLAAKTWYVNGGGGGDVSTIQEGIDVASDGDTVMLAAAVYSGPGNTDVNFKGKAVVVTSQSGHSSTTIDCGSSTRAFILQNGEGAGSVINGITIRDGFHASFGGAIYCIGASPTISDNVFVGNESTFRGGAVYCDTSTATLIHNTFEMNTSGFGGAVWCSGGQSLTITDNEFISNVADFSGGAIASRETGTSITTNTFELNTAANDGGAIYCDQSSTNSISTNEFHNNSATGNGGAIAWVSSTVTVDFNLFKENSGALGGAVYVNDLAGGGIDRNTFDKNEATSGSGAAIYCTNFSAPPISKNIFSNSTTGNAVGTGNDSVPLISCCCFYNNEGGDLLPPGSFNGGGNFIGDPEYCGIPGSGNYYLQADSPCTPGNHPNGASCETIGAMPISCGTTSAKVKSWGAIKDLYKND
jgi:predicted outer membrane repeat protein